MKCNRRNFIVGSVATTGVAVLSTSLEAMPMHTIPETIITLQDCIDAAFAGKCRKSAMLVASQWVSLELPFKEYYHVLGDDYVHTMLSAMFMCDIILSWSRADIMKELEKAETSYQHALRRRTLGARRSDIIRKDYEDRLNVTKTEVARYKHRLRQQGWEIEGKEEE